MIPYITPEFPVKGITVPLIQALAQSGVSIIEVGIPFSDPLADGPTIQHTSEIALKNGVTIPMILHQVKEVRKTNNIPIILMGYINPILAYGMERFCLDASTAGVDGVIIPDLPPEESDEFRKLCQQYKLSVVFLVAPTSSDERIRYLDELTSDFTYCVSVTGVTGAATSFDSDFDKFLSRVKKNTKKPFVVGFGIKSKEQIDHIITMANGVVVGSALLHSLEGKSDIDDIVTSASKFISSLM